MRDRKRVRARQTNIPLNANGTAAPTNVQAIGQKSTDGFGMKSSECPRITPAMETAKSTAHRPIALASVACGQPDGRRNTASAPAVIPSMAIEMDMKAK